MKTITVFTYRAVQWVDGKLVETPVQAIGFTDVAWAIGSKLGEFRLDEESKQWSFYPMAILANTPLSLANLQTITDKLNQLNSDAASTKKGSGLQQKKAQTIPQKEIKIPERD